VLFKPFDELLILFSYLFLFSFFIIFMNSKKCFLLFHFHNYTFIDFAVTLEYLHYLSKD
jgi:hypothetical protein